MSRLDAYDGVTRSDARLLRCVLAVLALSIVACGAWAQSKVLRYGQAPSAHKSIYSLPVALAEREGLFRREGLDFRVVILVPGGADRMIHALHDDTVDITHVATPFLVRAALAGSDAVAIAAEFNDPIYSLVARPDVARIGDLKGRTVGMADPGGSIAYSMRKLFALHGLREGDVHTKMIDGTPARLNCLRTAGCDAVPLGQPHDVLAQAEGFRLLGVSNDAVPEYLYTVTAARRSWAAANPDLVVRYVRALAASFDMIHDPARRVAVVAAIVDITGVPAGIAERVLNLYSQPGRKALPRRGEIDPKGVAQVIAFMAESGRIKPPLPDAEQFVDLRYLARAGVR
jgi:ABC-type nitrate/sulfonate/bicarbonate transport system substrate-binding protein